MKDKLIACILLLAFTGCQRAEISSETETTEELTTATEKPSEIATESASATTEAPLVIVINESTTELMDESTGEATEILGERILNLEVNLIMAKGDALVISTNNRRKT